MVASAIVTALVVLPALASAESVGDVQSQIQSLMNQLRQLQAQLILLQGRASTTPMMGHGSDDASSTHGMMGNDEGMKGGNTCPALGRSLAFGNHDQGTGDVTKLQTFLTAQGYFHDSINGIFGASTQTAVKAFQTATGVAIGGSPSTNGFGAVGPKTRRMIEKHCGEGKDMEGDHKDQMGGDGPRPWMGTSTPGKIMRHEECMATTTGMIMGRPCPSFGENHQGQRGGDGPRPWMGTSTSSQMMTGDDHHEMMPPPPAANGWMHQ